MSQYYHYCPDIHNKVGRRIWEIRISRNLTRQDIADSSSVPITIEELKQTETQQYCLTGEQLSAISKILQVSAVCFFQPDYYEEAVCFFQPDYYEE